MKIRKVWAVSYSATGTTKQAADTLGKTLAQYLHVPFEGDSFVTPEERGQRRAFSGEDLVVVGSPTYAGRVPNKIAPSFREKLVGQETPAVAVVTFGNRSYDNALAELCAILEGSGFCTVGGVACVARHAFSDKLAAGRPNAGDVEELTAFGQRLGERLLQAQTLPPPVQVPGDAGAPYYVPKDSAGNPVNFLRAVPKTHEEICIQCGLCAARCPMGSIDKNFTQLHGICIKCHACVRGCPRGAKYFDDPAFLAHVAMLEECCAEPGRNAMFLADFR